MGGTPRSHAPQVGRGPAGPGLHSAAGGRIMKSVEAEHAEVPLAATAIAIGEREPSSPRRWVGE